jgi:hypothetical protein
MVPVVYSYVLFLQNVKKKQYIENNAAGQPWPTQEEWKSGLN